MKKKIFLAIMTMLLSLLLTIPCFAVGLSDTQVIFAVTYEGEIMNYTLFDYSDCSKSVLSDSEYAVFMEAGYEAEPITLKAFSVIEEETSVELYGASGWDKYYPQSIEIFDISEIPEDVVLHKVTDLEGNLHYLYFYNNLYYDVPNELYRQYELEVLMNHVDTENALNEKDIENTQTYGSGVLNIIPHIGAEVKTERLYVIVRCAETTQEYSFYLDPPEFSVQATLPIGTYTYMECGSFIDNDIVYKISDPNVIAEIKSGMETESNPDIGEQLTREDLISKIKEPTTEDKLIANAATDIEKSDTKSVTYEDGTIVTENNDGSFTITGTSIENETGRLLSDTIDTEQAKKAVSGVAIAFGVVVLISLVGGGIFIYKRIHEDD